MSTGPTSQNPPDEYSAREKTEFPGLVLLLVGVLNLLLSFWLVLSAIHTYRMTDEQLEQSLEILHNYPPWQQALEQGEIPPPEKLRTLYQIIFTVWAVLSLGAALLVILAGLRMRALRSFGLVAMGALAACLPGVSCTGCCCLGQIAGLWAVVVLFNPEVRQAFR